MHGIWHGQRSRR